MKTIKELEELWPVKPNLDYLQALKDIKKLIDELPMCNCCKERLKARIEG